MREREPDMLDGFEFCNVRWSTPDAQGEHVCAEHQPGHDRHVCCCEAVLRP